MTVKLSDPETWQHQDYNAVIQLGEEAINAESHHLENYWYLGLAYLLSGDEESSQSTWLYGLSQVSEDESDQNVRALTNLLEHEAIHQFKLNQKDKAWIIRQYFREISPDSINNLLHLINLSIDLSLFEEIFFEEWEIFEHLKNGTLEEVDSLLLLQTILDLIAVLSINLITFIDLSFKYSDDISYWLSVLFPKVIELGDELEKPALAADIAEICFKKDPSNLDWIRHLSRFLTNAHRFKRALEVSEIFFDLCETLEYKFLGNYQILRILTYSGKWLDVQPVAKLHKQLLQKLTSQTYKTLTIDLAHTLIASTGFLAYLQDDIDENYKLRSVVADTFQKALSINQYKNYKTSNHNKKIKIGYIAHTLRTHSVGWLARWLFQHHNTDIFDTNIYFVNQNLEDEFYRTWFKSAAQKSQSFGIDAEEIAQAIYDDGIQILVDLDSITLNVTYEVMARKPAPVQVSWLGWDAPGLSSIDYFITDPYVLPASAESLYLEKPWRLDNTYIAVDGFEVGVPTLHRRDLGIPDDGVIFYSAQAGAKRHPSTVQLQLKIIKEVQNSYFLIKGVSDQSIIEEFFYSLAQDEGVNFNKLKFLPKDPNEYVHRANLQIADIVLDTYPYNGATTTLETLWMGIPLVTRVGSTFSSRNSYAFMMNVGVTEGIAWTDEEYINWGIRLGRDETLRQHITWKLKQSRQTSPLWNAKQFTREMENAYQHMWEIYIGKKDKI
jgi:predicted O-linked N-acetylglucosamine transferase (SPINDLY family)